MKTFLWLISLFISTVVNAQGYIISPEGMILVFNFQNNHFHIELKGEEIFETETENVFVIDDKLVQVLTLPRYKFLNDTTQRLSDSEFISKYIGWETDYLKTTFYESFIDSLDFHKTNNGKEFAFWRYDMPFVEPEQRTDSTVTVSSQKQLFAITKIKDRVVGVHSPLFETNQYGIVKNYLFDCIESIVKSEKPIDLEELNKQINK